MSKKKEKDSNNGPQAVNDADRRQESSTNFDEAMGMIFCLKCTALNPEEQAQVLHAMLDAAASIAHSLSTFATFRGFQLENSASSAPQP